MTVSRDKARVALAVIRMINGTVALFAPSIMLRRLGADPAANGVAIYPLRMFGIRTIVLAADLILGDDAQNSAAGSRALRAGVVIHAADAASAATAGLRRQLPAKVALVATGISLTNTALAVTLARSAGRPPARPAGGADDNK